MNYILQKYHRSVSNVAMVCVAAVALGSSTYAWFVTNNSVKAKNMTVTANADVEFLEIANVGENFTGSTIAVEAKTPGTGLKLNPVTPLKVSNMDSTGAEQEDLDFSTTGTKGTNGWADDFTWKWTTAQVGTASAKADSVACEKTQSSFFTSPFFEKNKLKMRAYGIIRNDSAVIAFLINAACIVMYEQVQENANVEIYARIAYMDTMTGLGNRTVSVTESAVMSS